MKDTIRWKKVRVGKKVEIVKVGEAMEDSLEWALGLIEKLYDRFLPNCIPPEEEYEKANALVEEWEKVMGRVQDGTWTITP